MDETEASPEAYLKDYHRRRAGATAIMFGQIPMEADGRRFASTYHYLVDRVPTARGRLRVLDLACGDGFLLALLAQRRQRGLELYGVDFSESELAAAQRRRSGAVQLVRANARCLPLQTGSIDVVVSHMAMMLMNDIPAVIGEVARVLRPHGQLSVIIGRSRQANDSDVCLPFISAAVEKAGLRQIIPWGDARMGSVEGIEELLRSEFEETTTSDLNCVFRLDLQAYWERLQATYAVDILPECLQIALQSEILSAVRPLVETDGKISTGFAVRHFSAFRRSEPSKNSGG